MHVCCMYVSLDHQQFTPGSMHDHINIKRVCRVLRCRFGQYTYIRDFTMRIREGFRQVEF